MALTPRQQRFVDEYLVDLNGTQAATRAGYSPRTANEQAARLLANASVAAAVQAAKEKRAERVEITQDMVLKELAKIGFANMHDYMRVGPDGDPVLDFSALTRDQAAALSEVTVEDYVDGRGEDAREVKRVKFKLADKRASLVDIGKHIGMFKERIEVKHVTELEDDELDRQINGYTGKA
ncbi:terminase small subunit [Comamonas odontotermitis]|uniref:terminase small subunit n=1 Tax=Comamonas odontotermitis TaxID=379895 RepID=UPI0016138B4C|nr:terminase small subunit [Comamonas odontotermitis]